ncbi:peptidase S8 [Anaerobacillus alkalilacustris]|uniref:Peptidase S8 n=1 Tax=Anaerobacillus alkalilacustris TaxID=393763 RepID=A0A1S2LST9_9BACI|nr:S8 family peptidase [Anaerobacillus alkalilacustris]OIJ14737.1 peptidase S8 [Anaerobacillus alkalilacustris]
MRRLATLFSIVMIGVIAIWYANDHHRDEYQGQSLMQKQAVDQVLAEDLALTTSLFIDQLKSQLLRWSEQDFSNEELQKKFQEELITHDHFEAFALVNKGEIEYMIGEIHEQDLKKLNHSYDGIESSDPYTKDGNEYMLFSCTTADGNEVLGEVDLSFVKKYVRDLAHVADANGNLFIGGEDVEVEFEGEGIRPYGATEKVPELGWEISVQSEPDTEVGPDYVEHEVIISFVPGVNGEQWIEDSQLVLVKNGGPYYVVRDQARTTDKLVYELSLLEEVETVEPNYFYTKQQESFVRRQGDFPNDEFFEPYQWNLTQIFAEIGWNITGGTEDIPIAILDSGIDPNHEDLKERILYGYNAFKDDDEFFDEHGHGTHVAGITAATTNNLTGIAGVSWFNPILPVKVLNENAEGTAFEIANGIRWATDHGAKVINMSLGDTFNSKIMHDAIRYAYKNDVVLIAAAGNDNVETPMYPAAYDEVIAVSAVDDKRHKAIFSNYGNHIDVTAPGEHIPSTFLDNTYVMMSGTSMAAPHVAGLAGLIRSINPSLTNDEVAKVIIDSANDIGPRGFDPYYGHGEINVVRALQMLENN